MSEIAVWSRLHRFSLGGASPRTDLHPTGHRRRRCAQVPITGFALDGDGLRSSDRDLLDWLSVFGRLDRVGVQVHRFLRCWVHPIPARFSARRSVRSAPRTARHRSDRVHPCAVPCPGLRDQARSRWPWSFARRVPRRRNCRHRRPERRLPPVRGPTAQLQGCILPAVQGRPEPGPPAERTACTCTAGLSAIEFARRASSPSAGPATTNAIDHVTRRGHSGRTVRSQHRAELPQPRSDRSWLSAGCLQRTSAPGTSP